MLMSGTLHRLLLAGTCLCVYGAPVHLSNFTPTRESGCDGECASSVKTVRSTHPTDVKSKPSNTKHVTGLILNVGAGGGAGPHGRPEGIAPVTQTENGDSLDGRSGRSEAGGEAWSQRGKIENVGSSSEMGDAERQSEATSVLSVDSESTKEDEPAIDEHKSTSTGGEKQLDIDMSTSSLTPGGLLASSTAPPQPEPSYSQNNNEGDVDRARLPGGGESFQEKDPETSSPSFTEKLYFLARWIYRVS